MDIISYSRWQKLEAYFNNKTYLQAVDATVSNLVEKNAMDGFYEIFPAKKGNTNLYGVSALIKGLVEIYQIAKDRKSLFLQKPDHYAYLALIHTLWMYRENEAGAVMWYPEEDVCLDNTVDDKEGNVSAGTSCGAESAIEGGLVQLAINAIRCHDRYLINQE